MTWWCAATRLPWSWQPRAYPGVWAFVAVLAVLGRVVARRNGARPTSRQRTWWVLGLLALWLATDWPVGTLGSGYLASAHMVQYMLYTFVAAPLLLLGVPEQVARRSPAWVRRAIAAGARPLPAGIVANVVMVGTHAPWTVDTLRTTQAGSFALDLLWLVGGVVLWLPVIAPLAELRAGVLARSAYLFLAAGLVPMVPGGFLTFADRPLYALYELAPRIGGLDPTTDQQVAGVLMKVGNLPLIWPVIGAIFVRGARREGPPTAFGTNRPAPTTRRA